MIRKVGHIFVTLDGNVKGDVQGVDTVCCTISMMIDLAANVAGTSLEHLVSLLSGTDEVIEKITGHKPMGLEEFITKHRSAFE